jgi:quercetin dioxygenase-like cupin family protein
VTAPPPSEFTVHVRLPAALVVFAALALTACSIAPAPATPASEAAPPASASSTAAASSQPIVVDELGKGSQDAPVDVDVAGPAQVAFRKITIKPGAGTGLHCHDGQLVAVVEKGVFSHYAPTYPTGEHTYVAGDSLVEGAHYVHEGKNEGTQDVVLLVTYIIPSGDPLAETDLSKCDR